MADKQKKIEKSKDGIPIWDGDASTFQEYEECAQLWEQGTPYHKRYLCGPRLVSELTGTAKRFTVGKDPTWVSYAGGVDRLLAHLRSRLGLPQMPEMTEHLSKFFKHSRRRRGESMNEYITRKSETYARACQGLLRVMKSQGTMPMGPSTGSSRWSTASDPWSRYQAPQRRENEEQEARDPLGSQASDVNQGDGEEQGGATSEAGVTDASGQWDWWSSSQWQSSGWRSSWPQSQWQDSWSEEASWLQEAPSLLPDFVQGWYLLFDGNLDTNERNMVIAALRGDFSYDRVAQELRNQWSDDDLRRRDMNNRSQAMWAEDEAYEIDDDKGDYDALVADPDLTEEGQALLMSAEEEAQQALVQLEQNKRTLKEARNKQHQVRMSRRYFRTSFQGNDRKPNQSGKLTCLKCGGDHRAANCPKQSGNMASSAEVQSAPFICFAEDENAEHLVNGESQAPMAPTSAAHVPRDKREEAFGLQDGNLISTKDAVYQGKAVVDGGATKTLGSVVALERVMELNKEKRGNPGLKSLDLGDRPTFGFGNSSRDQCVSTASMSIEANGQPGEVRIHALDRGEGPILFSIDSLRSLGAIIDFESDLVVFRRLTDSKVIHLERSSTGHQLLPLTEDLYSQATATSQPVPCLKAYI